jgi:hypothetical protein
MLSVFVNLFADEILTVCRIFFFYLFILSIILAYIQISFNNVLIIKYIINRLVTNPITIQTMRK